MEGTEPRQKTLYKSLKGFMWLIWSQGTERRKKTSYKSLKGCKSLSGCHARVMSKHSDHKKQRAAGTVPEQSRERTRQTPTTTSNFTRGGSRHRSGQTGRAPRSSFVLGSRRFALCHNLGLGAATIRTGTLKAQSAVPALDRLQDINPRNACGAPIYSTPVYLSTPFQRFSCWLMLFTVTGGLSTVVCLSTPSAPSP